MILFSNYPNLCHALALLGVDSGAILVEAAPVPEGWQARVALAEAELSKFSKQEVEILVMGEESEQAELKPRAPNADAVLVDAFDGDLGDLLLKPLLNAFDYLGVENRAQELGFARDRINQGG